MDFNYWYNGGEPLEDPGDGSWLVEGSGSIYTGASPNPDPDLGGSVGELDIASPALPGVITQALHPNASSPLVGLGSATLPGFAPLDHAGVARPTPPSIGAFEPAPP